MKTVRKIAEEIVKREGGFVNDPDDPGGATKYGLTIGTMKSLGLDLDGDGDVDILDVHKVTPKVATDVFLDSYYYKPKLDRLPRSLSVAVFDMQVNSGNNAVKILQRLLNKMADLISLETDLVVDGSVGAKTADAAKKAHRLFGSGLVDAYSIDRRNWYYELADRRKASRKYATTRAGTKGGWIKRAEDFMSLKYHLTNKQHMQRTSKW